MLHFKIGVSLKGMVPQMAVALQVAEAVFRDEADANVIVTSGNDSQHSPTSLHYLGRAVDLRTKHLLPGQPEIVADTLRRALGHLGFDVVFEGRGTDSEHIHLELDRRAGY